MAHLHLERSEISSEQIPITPRAIVTLITLALITCISYIDRIMVGALAPLLKAEFGLSDTQLGILTGFAFTFFFAVGGIPLALWADRGSRRLIISLSLAAWSLMTALCGLAQNFWHLLFARLGVGIGEAGSAPASFSLISDLFSARVRPVAISVWLTGTMLGLLLGLSFAGWLGATFGWRAAFLLLGLPGMLLAIGAYVLIYEPRQRAGATIARHEGPTIRQTFALLGSNRGYLWLVISLGLQGFSVFGMSQWLPSFFVRSHDMSLAQVSIWFGTTFGVGMMLGALVGGPWCARYARRDPLTLHVAIIGALATAPAYLVALWAPTIPTAIAAIFVGAFFAAVSSPAAGAFGQAVVEPRTRATAQAFMNFFNSMFGFAVATLLVGMASDALHPHVGEDSLRWALTGGQVLTVLCAGTFALAMAEGRRQRAARRV